MYSFMNDCSEGAHPKVRNALKQSNDEHFDGYGFGPDHEGSCGDDQKLIASVIRAYKPTQTRPIY